MIRIAFLCVVACSNSRDTPTVGSAAAPTASPCDRAVERMRAFFAAMDPARLDKAASVLRTHCARWPAAVQSCMIDARDPSTETACIGQLPQDLAQSWVTEIKEAIVGPFDCDQMADTALRWVVVPVHGDPELRAELAVREVLLASCAKWPAKVLQCVAKQDVTAEPLDCVDEPARSELAAQLTRRRALFEQAGKQRASAPSCAQVAAKHYGDDDKSRAALEKACAEQAWHPYTRRCVVAAKTSEERGWCVDTASRWTSPAATTLPSTPLPDCNLYIATVERLATCALIPQAQRDALRTDIEKIRRDWGKLDPNSVESVPYNEVCREAVRRIKRTMGRCG